MRHAVEKFGLLLLGLLLWNGCVASTAPPGAPLGPSDLGSVEGSGTSSGTASGMCIDLDQDGYGSGCAKGADCDDNDAKRAAECGAPGQTRSCSGEVTEPCYVLKSTDAGGFHCSKGSRRCQNNVWGYCQIESSFTRALPTTALITGPLTCNPCNPQCATSVDQPQTNDLSTSNSQDVVFDSQQDGITLKPTGNGSGTDLDNDGVPDCVPAATGCNDPNRNPSYCDPFPTDPARNCYAETGGLFHLLPYNSPAVVDPLDINIALKTVDIYFLMDTTGSMQGEIDNLRNSLTSGNFISNPASCGLDAGTTGSWTAQYYNNRTLTDVGTGTVNRLCYTRSDASINFAWGSGSPGNPAGSVCGSFPVDNFSVRWTSTVRLVAPGPIVFRLQRDDGMRIYVDGNLVYNAWTNGAASATATSANLTAGDHSVVVEYYELNSTATANVSLELPAPVGYEGIIGSTRCQIPNTAFGVGYFDDIPRGTFGYSFGDGACNDAATSTLHDLPFVQLLPITPPDTVLQRSNIYGAVSRLVAKCGVDAPEAQPPALYALASGAGLPISVPGSYSTPAAVALPTLAANPPVRNVNAVGGSGGTVGSLVTQYDAGDVTSATLQFNGTTTGMLSSSYGGQCNANSTAPNATYRFAVTRRTAIAISSEGSSFDTVLNLFGGNSAYLTCNDNFTGFAGNTSLITRTLDPGTYFVVIDGRNTSSAGAYRLTIGPRIAETLETAHSVGNLSSNWVQLSGTTAGMSNDYSNLTCAGGDSRNSPDAVFGFTLSQASNVVITAQGSGFDTILRLYNAGFSQLYCNNGSGNLSSIFQRLQPGTYYVMLEGVTDASGTFALGMGAWPETTPDKFYTPAQGSCPQAAFGYPCFRSGTIPVVVMFTDTSMHNGPGAADRYDIASPSYSDAAYALRSAGIKVIGIHSGTASSTSCSTPCLEYSYGAEVCTTATRTVCTVSAPREWVCNIVRVCLQGTCWDENQCNWHTPCLQYGTQTYQSCNTPRTCVRFGPQVCWPSYRTSESHLRTLASDTGALKADGSPMVYQIRDDGNGLSETVVQAIAELAGVSRMDITLRANDNAATSAVDERQFLKTIAAIATPTNPTDPPLPSATRCIQTFDTWFRGCLPGTDVKFAVTFRNDLVTNTQDDQVFDFTIDVMGDGRYLLDTVKVRIVVPGRRAAYPGEGRYWRDYDATQYCSQGQLPIWGSLQWQASFPAGTAIRWEVRAAATLAGIDTAKVVSWVAPATPSPVNVADRLKAAGVPVEQPYLRLTAVLLASADLSAAPLLRDFELRYDCASRD